MRITDRRTVNVLYAGRLDAAKGVDLLLEAFGRALGAEPRLHLLVAGTGPLEPALRRRLGKRVTLLGWLERPALLRAYGCADVAWASSDWAVRDARAAGVPVLAAGPRWPADADAHAATLVRLAGSRALSAPLRGRRCR